MLEGEEIPLFPSLSFLEIKRQWMTESEENGQGLHRSQRSALHLTFGGHLPFRGQAVGPRELQLYIFQHGGLLKRD